jgi:hypothetical protein
MRRGRAGDQRARRAHLLRQPVEEGGALIIGRGAHRQLNEHAAAMRKDRAQRDALRRAVAPGIGAARGPVVVYYACQIHHGEQLGEQLLPADMTGVHIGAIPRRHVPFVLVGVWLLRPIVGQQLVGGRVAGPAAAMQGLSCRQQSVLVVSGNAARDFRHVMLARRTAVD